MAVIRPFKALRPAKDFAQKVASVPYDVVNRDEAAELAKNNIYSLLNVTRSEISFPSDVNPYSPEIYLKAKENLNAIIDSKALVEDPKPHFYLYRLIMDGRAQTGIAATFSVDDYENDVIMKHEKTRKEKEDDRTNHIITTGAQTGPVFLTYKGSQKIDEAVKKITEGEKPEYDFESVDGIKHTVWVVPNKYNDLFVNEIAATKNLYIADGHHRAASAFRTRNEMKNNNPKHTGEEEYNFFIGVLFPADQLQILPYNRVVYDLNGKNKNVILNEISDKFDIRATDDATPDEPKTFCMYIDKQWYLLQPKDAIAASNSLAKSVAETLDVSVLQDFILNPVFNIDDPRTNKRVDFVGGIRGTNELERLVDSGKAAVAFSLYPVSVEDLMKISDAGEIMPPKSTWFEPKLRDGLLVHKI
ncbi:MAG TPA: DUF1015 family protein [Ignavibacteriaceae bacterium]|nr:DUF1015 family protein [Ignavibacteriaceae bacterium]